MSEKISLQFTCTDHFISKEVFRIGKCNECGFQFTQDYPEEKEIGKYYESDDYISHSDTSKGIANKLYRMARNIMLRRKLALIRNVTGLKNGNLLDIGSGTGHFAYTMKKAGWQVKGIEPNEKAVSFSTSNFGLEIISPDDISKQEPGSFDCITLWHVLEHFHDPFRVASGILRLLKPDGVCIIALPNSISSDAIHYGRFWAAYDVPRHLWHFNPSTFSLFAQKTGLTLETSRKLPLDVFYISVLSEKYKGARIPFISGMIKGLWFSVLSIFTRNRTSSLIYILHATSPQSFAPKA